MLEICREEYQIRQLASLLVGKIGNTNSIRWQDPNTILLLRRGPCPMDNVDTRSVSDLLVFAGHNLPLLLLPPLNPNPGSTPSSANWKSQQNSNNVYFRRTPMIPQTHHYMSHSFAGFPLLLSWIQLVQCRTTFDCEEQVPYLPWAAYCLPTCLCPNPDPFSPRLVPTPGQQCAPEVYHRHRTKLPQKLQSWTEMASQPFPV